MAEVVKSALSGGVMTLTLSRPQRRNALSGELVHALTESLRAAEQKARVVVLAGAGETFCAGGDLRAMESVPGQATFAELIGTLERMEIPTIARVQGAALGGGLALVAACHFAIAEESTVFGTPEIGVGLFPFVAMRPLLRLLPRRRALEMMLLGQRINALEAARVGLITRVADAGLDTEVTALAERLAAGPPETTRRGLRAMHRQATMPDDEALRWLYDELVACLETADAREGLAAFADKRAPDFSGTGR